MVVSLADRVIYTSFLAKTVGNNISILMNFSKLYSLIQHSYTNSYNFEYIVMEITLLTIYPGI
jgi:hypothetical protein